jgi:hypothetical protein
MSIHFITSERACRLMSPFVCSSWPYFLCGSVTSQLGSLLDRSRLGGIFERNANWNLCDCGSRSPVDRQWTGLAGLWRQDLSKLDNRNLCFGMVFDFVFEHDGDGRYTSVC